LSGVADRLAGPVRARVVRIPDGITVPPGKRRPARLGSPLRLCVIGSITGGDGKGQHRAVETLARLGDRGIDATLSVVGPVLDEDYAERVRATARRCGVTESVVFTGAVGDVPALLADHDILLFCSSQGADVTPLVLMEALIEGRPVVAADVGSVAEVVPADCGTVVAAEDPDAMAEAVARLAADPEEARAQAERGGRRVRREYDRQAGLERLWREVVAAISARSGAQVPSRLVRFSDGRTRDAFTQADR
jgi:colanic acid/amylovoran biosynthesis glycosyltransferase